MKGAKLSFVIPVYNKESYISECLDSVRNQTYKNIEIVVVDDKSKDDSLDIIKWHAKLDDRIKVFELKENKGRSFTRNFGNKKATGDIILVQDADDISLPDRALITLKAMQFACKKIFYASFYVGDIYGKPLQEIRAEPFSLDRVKRDRYTYIGHSTMAYSKNVILSVKYNVSEWSKLGLDDWKLQMDLVKNGYSFKYSEKPVLIYRQVPNSISRTRDQDAVNKLKQSYLEKL
jgi:glycosyltransferase involved in cell wall biosynthesis